MAKLGIKAHAHMLRHACGFKRANDGVDTRALHAYLEHRNIQNTTRHKRRLGAFPLVPAQFASLPAGQRVRAKCS